MNRIILIGNGFDLAHGLKTRYEDFINWYFDQLRTKLYHCDSSEYNDGLCRLKIDTRLHECSSWRCTINFYGRNIWSIKESNLFDYIKKYVRASIHESDLLKHILKSISSKGWVDVENDYYELLKGCTDLNDSVVTNLQNQLWVLQKKLIEYLLDVQQANKSNLSAIDCIRDKIYEPIRKDDIMNDAESKFIEMLLQNQTNPENVLFLDFNYTNTTSLYSDSIIHIHGDLNNPKSIIFGYGDELDEYYKKLSNLNDNRYLTNIKSIRYLENSNYRNLLRFVNSAPYQVYIIGYSCGNSDRTLLNTLFEHKNCVSIKPFYYQIDNEQDNHSEIVQNMSRCFTDMQVFRSKVVDKTLCEPLPQTLPLVAP